MATHSSVLAWRIPATGEPGGLPSMGSQSRTRLKQLSSSMFNSLLLNDQLLEKKTYLIHLHTLRTEQTLAESVHNYYGHGNQISNLLELFCNQDNEVYDFLCTVLFFFLFFFFLPFFFFICGRHR